MAGRATKNHKTASDSPSQFVEKVRQALNKLDQPAWLGENSPLATAYFLADALGGRNIANTAASRGEAVIELIRFCISNPSTSIASEPRRFLQLSYLGARRPSREAVCREMGISQATYHRIQKVAFCELADAIAQRSAPAMRRTGPPSTTPLLEREDHRRLALTSLAEGKSIAIVGPPGCGKTALGAAIAREFDPTNTFWHACTPNLGDNLNSFIFGLAHFLMRSGHRELWLYLISEWRDTSLAEAASLSSVCAAIAQSGLQGMGNSLIVLDDIDRLHPDDFAAHAQLLAFVRLLQSHSRIMLIGGLASDADIAVTVGNFSKSAVESLLARDGLDIGAADAILRFTQGNPRLVQLVATYLRLGGSGAADAALAGNDGMRASIDGVFRRIWQRLSIDEQRIVIALSVLRKPIARDIWMNGPDAPSLTRLIDLRIVVEDLASGVALAPAYHAAAQAIADEDAREAAHLVMADARASYGQITEAAFHYIKARQPALALHIWNAHKASQISQGETGPALQIFKEVAHSHVALDEQDLLHVLRAEMARIVGEYDYAEHELARASTSEQSPFAIQILRQKGDLLQMRGESEQSLVKYRKALQVAQGRWQTLTEQIISRADVARALLQDAAHEEAWHETQIARHEVEFLQGLVLEYQKRYAQAVPYYRSAVAIARDVGHLEGEAKAAANLAVVLTQLDATPELLADIEAQLGRAIAIYERIGKVSQIVSKLNDMAVAQNIFMRHGSAQDYASQALARAQKINWQAGIATTSQSLAEAKLGLGDLDGAEAAAHQVLNLGGAAILPDGLRVLGEVHLARGNLALAERMLRQSIHEAACQNDWYLEAYGWRALGRCLKAMGSGDQAAQAFDEAKSRFHANGMADELRRTLQAEAAS